MIVINNHFENFWLYDFAHRDEVDIWLGMRENVSLHIWVFFNSQFMSANINQGTEDKYVWVNGIANGGENVINDRWEDQEPKSRGGKGAAIMASSSHDKWSTRDYDGETLSFVCEKPLGDFCLFDMIDHQKFCYDFNFDPNVPKTPWTNARDGCGNLGLQMITVNTHGLDNWITKTLYNSGLFSTPSSLNGMWIGYYETDKTTSEFKLFPDNTTLSGDMYDARRDDIQYTEELDCLYTVACPGNETGDCSYGADEFHRWNSDQCENPGFNHIQGCRIPKGQPIDVSNLMHRKFIHLLLIISSMQKI